MNQKFRNKYRVSSTRLKDYDYSQNNAYFVTICTKNREHIFGEILNGEMQHSEIGNIVKHCWYEIPNHFSFVELGESIIMPNHVHGILIFNKNRRDAISCVSKINAKPCLSKAIQNYKIERDAKCCVSTVNSNKFQPQSQNLASVIRGFKAGVTKLCRSKTNIYVVWQARYHDHIIRNEQDLSRIEEYIYYNPQSWENDDYFSGS